VLRPGKPLPSQIQIGNDLCDDTVPPISVSPSGYNHTFIVACERTNPGMVVRRYDSNHIGGVGGAKHRTYCRHPIVCKSRYARQLNIIRSVGSRLQNLIAECTRVAGSSKRAKHPPGGGRGTSSRSGLETYRAAICRPVHISVWF